MHARFNRTLPPRRPRGHAFLARMQPIREVVRPDNQLSLGEAVLNEEIAKMLTANNPAAPKNIIRFNMKDKVRCACSPRARACVEWSARGGNSLRREGSAL